MTKTLKTSEEGRKCMFPECACVLSIYNSEKYCHKHLEQIAKAKIPKEITNPAAAIK